MCGVPGTEYIPKMCANPSLILSQIPDLESCLSQSKSDGLAKAQGLNFGNWKKKNPTNFNPFIVNLREHCDLQLSGFVTDEKIDLRKPLLKKKNATHTLRIILRVVF